LASAVHRRRDVNHLVLATDCGNGRHAGFLIAYDGVTAREPFLLLEATLSCAAADREVVLRRMIAVGILRLIGLGQPPPVIAALTRNPALCNALLELSHHVAHCGLHPDPLTNVASLATASMAHRVARAAGERPRFDVTARAMLQAGAGSRGRWLDQSRDSLATPVMAVLDLRATSESALIDGARGLYRSRRPRPGLPAAALPGAGLPRAGSPGATDRRFRPSLGSELPVRRRGTRPQEGRPEPLPAPVS
jgi:hypothetical protein